MKDPYYHVNQPGECPVCGLSFEHMHPDKKNKPKEFIRGLTTKNPPEQVEDEPWWWKYTEQSVETGNCVDNHDIPELLAEHRKRVVREIREAVEQKLKRLDGKTFTSGDFTDGCLMTYQRILSLPELKEDK